MRLPFPRPVLSLAAVLAVFHVSSLGAFAQSTWFVDQANPNAPGTGTALDPYTSVQFAISQATTVSGDFVEVEPGVYFENIDFLGKNLFIRSADGPALTILDGGGNGSVVTAASGEIPFTQIEGFTLRGGTGTFDAASGESRGGAVYCVNSSLAVRDCILTNNVTQLPGGTTIRGAGGGAYAFNAANFRLFDCVIENNMASRGGGAWIEQSDALVFFSAIRDNTAVAYDLNHGGHGGGVGVVDSTLNFDLCQVERNEAKAGQFVPARGGGLLVWSSAGSVLNSLFADNVAGTASSTQFFGQGGGVEVMFLAQPTAVEVAGCELRGNSALNGGGMFGGGPLFINSIHSNLAQSGAGVYSFGAVISDCTITNNFAE